MSQTLEDIINRALDAQNAAMEGRRDIAIFLLGENQGRLFNFIPDNWQEEMEDVNRTGPQLQVRNYLCRTETHQYCMSILFAGGRMQIRSAVDIPMSEFLQTIDGANGVRAGTVYKIVMFGDGRECG